MNKSIITAFAFVAINLIIHVTWNYNDISKLQKQHEQVKPNQFVCIRTGEISSRNNIILECNEVK